MNMDPSFFKITQYLLVAILILGPTTLVQSAPNKVAFVAPLPVPPVIVPTSVVDETTQQSSVVNNVCKGNVNIMSGVDCEG